MKRNSFLTCMALLAGLMTMVPAPRAGARNAGFPDSAGQGNPGTHAPYSQVNPEVSVASAPYGQMNPEASVTNVPYSQVLRSIEQYNPSLRTAAAGLEVQKLENRSEALLEDLEVEFNYLWGQNAEVGQRHDLSITQSFDIPTLLGMKARQAGALDSQAVLEYKAERLKVLTQAQELCIDAIYCNKLMAEYEVLLDYATRLHEAAAREVEMGESSLMELNKARLSLTSARAQVARVQLQKDEVMASLRALNGGNDVSLDGESYGASSLPADFESWFSQAAEANPVIAYVAAEIAISNNDIRIEKLSALPRLTMGYMSEIGLNDKYRGLTMGIAIPLWKSSSRIRQSQARATLAQERRVQAEQEFYSTLRSGYDKAVSLGKLKDEYMHSLDESDMRGTLFKALDHGEISMAEYMTEIDILYQILEQFLSTERDYMQALAQLNAVFL